MLNDSTAILTGATPRIRRRHPRGPDRRRGRPVGAQARPLAETKYSYEAYLERTRQACAALHGDGSPDPSRTRLPDKEPVVKDLA